MSAAKMPWSDLNPPYRTIVADPAWPFVWNGNAGGRRRRKTNLGYSTMSIEEILALPVAALADNDAHLFLWATRDVFREGRAVEVARAWGFEPVGEIIWRKRNFGTGQFPRPGHEPVLIARRGSLPWAGPHNVHSVQEWAQSYATNGGKSHTAKPDGLCDLAERVSPGPYVELFCRRPRLGWDHWGHGYEIGAAS